MKGPRLEIEFCAYYSEKKDEFDGGLYEFLQYCEEKKPKNVVVRIDKDMDFEEVDVFCENISISNLEHKKSSNSRYIASFDCDGKSGKSILKVIYWLGKTGNPGHTFSFEVDKDKFYFDGDGADRIMGINGTDFSSIKDIYELGKVWNELIKKQNENTMATNISESHGKKKHNGPKDTMAAMRKGNRDAEMDKLGGGFKQTKKIHKLKADKPSKKVDLDRLDDDMNESVARVSFNDLYSLIYEEIRKSLSNLI